jgi:hypothetical protein
MEKEKGIQTPIAQDRSTKLISQIEWIRTSWLSIKNAHSLSLASAATDAGRGESHSWYHGMLRPHTWYHVTQSVWAWQLHEAGRGEILARTALYLLLLLLLLLLC